MKKFVISSCSWIPASGGLTVLHKFVNDLNVLGYDAYLAPCGPSGLGWHNPSMPFYSPDRYNNVKLITSEVYDDLENAIVVYPESWYGNYLNAPNVVRWMMGSADTKYMSAGSMFGINYDSWSDKDLWFWYTPMYTTPAFNSFDRNTDNILFTFEFYKDIFKNTNQERVLNSWTLRKGEGKVSPENYIHSPEDFYIDLALPGRYRELSELFNKTKTFYSYDTYTFLNFQAVMCGADSVVVPMNGLTKEEYYSGCEFHRYIAYGVDELERVRSVRNELNDHIEEIEKKSIKSIHTFVEKCHDYFK